jgi:hypothetical protein
MYETPTTINLVEESIGIHFCDIGKDFLDMMPKAQSIKKLINWIASKNFHSLVLKECKDGPQIGKKYLQILYPICNSEYINYSQN